MHWRPIRYQDSERDRRPETRACLPISCSKKGEATPLLCELDPTKLTSLGRNRDNTIVLNDERASRQHAQVFFREPQWFVRDMDTLNGTALDGLRLREAGMLNDGHVIGIADMRFRFRLAKSPDEIDMPASVEGRPAGSTSTDLGTDGLAALYDFMTGTVEEAEPRRVIENALETISKQTGASVCGFLNLDLEDPLPKVVVPREAEVKTSLSRHLTAQVQKNCKMVWLGQESGGVETSDSLGPFPMPSASPCRPRARRVGALHVYNDLKAFGERQVRFASWWR